MIHACQENVYLAVTSPAWVVMFLGYKLCALQPGKLGGLVSLYESRPFATVGHVTCFSRTR